MDSVEGFQKFLCVCASVNNFFCVCFCYLTNMLWMESWESILWEMWKYVGAPLWIAGLLVHRLWLAMQNCDAYLCMFVVFVFCFCRWALGKRLSKLQCIKITAEAICQVSVLQACSPSPLLYVLNCVCLCSFSAISILVTVRLIAENAYQPPHCGALCTDSGLLTLTAQS